MWVDAQEYMALERARSVNEATIAQLQRQLKDMGEKQASLSAALEACQAELSRMEEARKNPQSVVEAIIGKSLEWYDYQELSPPDWLTYYREAQEILRSRVWQNEVAYLNSCFAKFSLQEAVDFQSVRDMRMSVMALQMLKERLESIRDPQNESSGTDLHAVI